MCRNPKRSKLRQITCTDSRTRHDQKLQQNIQNERWLPWQGNADLHGENMSIAVGPSSVMWTKAVCRRCNLMQARCGTTWANNVIYRQKCQKSGTSTVVVVKVETIKQLGVPSDRHSDWRWLGSRGLTFLIKFWLLYHHDHVLFSQGIFFVLYRGIASIFIEKMSHVYKVVIPRYVDHEQQYVMIAN